MMKFKISKLLPWILILFIAWVPIRVIFIKNEGPRLVRKITDYKLKNGVYPDSIEQVDKKSLFNPGYKRWSIQELKKNIEQQDKISAMVDENYKRLPFNELEERKNRIRSDEFNLEYSLFVFYRWNYSSEKKGWDYLD